MLLLLFQQLEFPFDLLLLPFLLLCSCSSSVVSFSHRELLPLHAQTVGQEEQEEQEDMLMMQEGEEAQEQGRGRVASLV